MFKKYNQKEDTGMGTNNFGKKITRLRKEKGLTQAKLAEQINVSNKAVSRWETGEGYPEITLLKPLARALGTTVDDLLSEEEETETQEETVQNETPVDVDALKSFRFIRFFRSLTVFNQIACLTLVASVVLLLLGCICSLLGSEVFGQFAISIYLVILGNVGIFCSILGLVLDLLGYGKKQTKGHLVFLALCVAGRYVFRYLAMFTMIFRGL